MHKKKRPTSVRIPEELDEFLLVAVRATGKSASDLLVECAKESLDAVVDRAIEHNLKAQEEIRRMREKRARKNNHRK